MPHKLPPVEREWIEGWGSRLKPMKNVHWSLVTRDRLWNDRIPFDSTIVADDGRVCQYTYWNGGGEIIGFRKTGKPFPDGSEIIYSKNEPMFLLADEGSYLVGISALKKWANGKLT